MCVMHELTAEQRRQLIDASQVFETWRTADREFRHSYRGTMHWRTVKGKQYLGRKIGNSWRSLGARSPATEKVKDDYTDARNRLRRRVTNTMARLKTMAPVNKATRIARVPHLAARILREVDEAGLLGRQLTVIGTHALFAYEVAAGVFFDGDLTATTDVDFLVDARRRMTFVVADGLKSAGLLGILQKVDRSFKREDEFRAANDEGYVVDFISPHHAQQAAKTPKRIIDVDGDLVPVGLDGAEWLAHVPRLDAVAIASDGIPVFMSCVDPRAFALHKWWVSKRYDREPIKKRRDRLQAQAVAKIATEYLSLSFKANDLKSLPKELIDASDELLSG